MNRDEVRQELLRNIAAVKEEYSLADLHPLHVGGTADYCTVASTTVDLAAAVKAAIDAEIPYLVLGQADKVLFSDGGYPGLLIINRSETIHFDRQRSQVVVDSGVRLQRLITQAATLGLGGLTPLYEDGGSTGGASYSNLTVDRNSFNSMVRSVTMLMPPTKLRPEAAIVRYKGEWLRKAGNLPKLKEQKRSQDIAVHQPVILTQLIQLTSMRPEEVRQQVGEQARRNKEQKERMGIWGPIFEHIPGCSIEQLILTSGAALYAQGGFFLDRYHPTYIVASGAGGRASDVSDLMELVVQRVHEVHGVTLVPRFERLGVW